MRRFLFFLTFVGGCVAVIAWLMGGSRAASSVSLEDAYDSDMV